MDSIAAGGGGGDSAEGALRIDRNTFYMGIKTLNNRGGRGSHFYRKKEKIFRPD